MASRAKGTSKHRANGIHPELQKQLASKGLWKGQEIIFNAPGEEKMSGVLLDFVAPYIVRAKTEEQFRMVIEMGILAWNTSLLPEDIRKNKVDALIKEAVPRGAADVMDLLNEMVERKLKYFADCRRWLIAHHVTMTGSGPSLSVVSTAERRKRADT
jgi:hypothetical protein